MPSLKTRRHIIFGVALAVLFGALIYGFVTRNNALLPKETKSYEGLTLEEDLQTNDVTQHYFDHRISVGEAAIEAREAAGQENMNIVFAVANDADFIGDLVRGREGYEAFLQLNPISYVAWSNYGSVLDRMGDTEGADEAYWQALNLNASAGQFDKYVRFLERNNADGVYDERLKEIYELSITVLGQEVWNMKGLAEWYLGQGDCEEAVDHYEVALQLAPDDPGLQNDLDEAKEGCR